MTTDTSRCSLVFALLILAVGCSSPAWATEKTSNSFFDRQGISLMYGRSTWTNVGPDPEVHYDWTSLAYVLGKDLTSWLALEGQAGPGYLNPEGPGDSASIEARILADLHYQFLFVKFGVGAAYLFDAASLPGIASAKLHSIISGTVGIKFLFRRQTSAPVELRLGYGVEHISAIAKDGSDGDTGWNAGGPRITVSWFF